MIYLGTKMISLIFCRGATIAVDMPGVGCELAGGMTAKKAWGLPAPKIRVWQ